MTNGHIRLSSFPHVARNMYIYLTACFFHEKLRTTPVLTVVASQLYLPEDGLLSFFFFLYACIIFFRKGIFLFKLHFPKMLLTLIIGLEAVQVSR
jgi:hypothetical protein